MNTQQQKCYSRGQDYSPNGHTLIKIKASTKRGQSGKKKIKPSRNAKEETAEFQTAPSRNKALKKGLMSFVEFSKYLIELPVFRLCADVIPF